MAYKGKRVVKPTRAQNIATIIGAVLCVVFGFMLICNLTIIIKGTINPDEPPSLLGTTPLVVLSGSMSGDAPDHIEAGDMIFVGKVAADELEVGDIIAFKQGKIVVTHRILEISPNEDGELFFTTQGDANETPDDNKVHESHIVGIYKHRIPKAGDLAIFIQTPLGMFLFVGVPLIAFIIYDIIRRQHYAARENREVARLRAELARLQAAAKEDDEYGDYENYRR